MQISDQIYMKQVDSQLKYYNPAKFISTNYALLEEFGMLFLPMSHHFGFDFLDKRFSYQSYYKQYPFPMDKEF